MTPTQLKVYAAIVRHGTSKAAAAELGIGEAAVSNHVASLRKELDDVLFERSGSGLRFTPGGLRLATRAVEILGLQEQTRHEVRAAADGRRILRLAVSSLFAEYAAPGLIELFSERADDLEVEMSVHSPGTINALLQSRTADLAIGPRPEKFESDLRVVEFLRYQLVVVADPKHRLAGREVSAKEVAACTWFLGPSAVEPAGVTARILRLLAVPERNQRIFQSHAEALTDARVGDGIALAPGHRVAADLDKGRLVRLRVPHSQADGVWSVVSLPRDKITPAAAELTRFVTSPRAIQAMLRGSGANISHFRPSVHVTLWS